MTTADTSTRPFTIATDRVGRRTIAVTTELTKRRLLAFAAGIGEWAPQYSDDLREGGLLGHPGLVESLMWNARHMPDDDTDPRAIPFGVHASTDWRFQRAFRAGRRDHDPGPGDRRRADPARGDQHDALSDARFAR